MIAPRRLGRISLLVLCSSLAVSAATAGPRFGVTAGFREAELTKPAYSFEAPNLRPGFEVGVLAKWSITDHVRLGIGPSLETIQQKSQYIDRELAVTWACVGLPARIDWGPGRFGPRVEFGVEPMIRIDSGHAPIDAVLSNESSPVHFAQIFEKFGSFPGGASDGERRISGSVSAGLGYSFPMSRDEGSVFLRWNEGVVPLVDARPDMRRRTRAIELAFSWLR